MTPGKLRKVPQTPSELGMYQTSGGLDGLSPGRRIVKTLWISRLAEDSVEGLEPLTRFGDLEALEITGLSGVDLEPLTRVARPLQLLRLGDVESVDLAPLAQVEAETLILENLASDCRVPSELSLSPATRTLAAVNDRRGLDGSPIKALADAIDWERLGQLKDLRFQVGGLEQLPAIQVDLGFLRHLPNLERLDISQGVRHLAAEPSPLEPPFEGLSRKLNWVRIDARQPETVKPQLTGYLGGIVPSVYQRHEPEFDKAGWAIDGPDDEGRWHTYGSLADELEGDYETEVDALQEATRRVQASDSALLERLDFDQESSGTSITAPSKDDLTRTLAALGIA